MFAGVRLDDDRRDRLAVRLERALDRRVVVERQHDRVGGDALVTPGESGVPFVSAPIPAEIKNESPWPW